MAQCRGIVVTVKPNYRNHIKKLRKPPDLAVRDHYQDCQIDGEDAPVHTFHDLAEMENSLLETFLSLPGTKSILHEFELRCPEGIDTQSATRGLGVDGRG